MENKKGFVEKVNQAIVGNVPSIEKVEYEKYHRADKDFNEIGSSQELLFLLPSDRSSPCMMSMICQRSGLRLLWKKV